MAAGNSLWHLITETDAISKAVLLILLCMSIAIWTIFLCKAYLFYTKKRDMKLILEKMRYARTINEIVVIAHQQGVSLPGSGAAEFVSQSVGSIKTVLADYAQIYGSDSTGVLDQIRPLIEQEVDIHVAAEEQYIPLVSTSAVISPLLGLLGTVWGLIHAFISISQTQVADIATVAPGIAEALITTLAGLVVAIPAVVMVNYLTANVVHTEQQLLRIADQMMRVVQRSITYKKEDICVDLAVGGQKELQQ